MNTESQIPFDSEKYQNICTKQNMLLKVIKEDNIYQLDFETENKNYNLDELMDFKIYSLIERLNEDVIEKIEIIKQYSDTEIDLLFVFKRIGASVGMQQKYMYIKTHRIKTDNLIIFKSFDIGEPITHYLIDKAERVVCKFADLTIIPYNNKLRINYTFNIDLCEDLPTYMDNLIGLMMKKIFYNLKLFIEKME
jgi:hypothetical protein